MNPRDRWPDRPARFGLLLAVACLPGTACGQSNPAAVPPALDGSVRVLFIGNSLTAFHDLPGMLRGLLEQEGVEATVESLARPAYGLEDHWSLDAVHERIAAGWDVVVLQQGPSATEGRPSLLEYAQRFAEEIRAGGGTPALYMVWPAEARFSDFPGVADSYRTAAERARGYLYPAGEAWLDAWEIAPDTPLYGPDRFHPSPLGTYAAALVMLEQLTGRDPRELVGGVPGFPDAASEQDADVVRRAAWSANRDHARRPD